MTKQHTTLPLLAIVASIAITLLPSALADDLDSFTVTELQAKIGNVTQNIIDLEADNVALLATVGALNGTNTNIYTAIGEYQDKFDTRTALVTHLQVQVDAFDAITDGGGVLTSRQSTIYAYHVAAITAHEEMIAHYAAEIVRYTSLLDANILNIISLENRISQQEYGIIQLQAAIVDLESRIDAQS